MRIEVDWASVRHNAAQMVAYCGEHGIDVVGVTKCFCGHPAVARAMLAGGIQMIGESRLLHIRRLREGGIDAPMMLLRLPRMSRADEVVRLAQVSLNSEVETVKALSQAAQSQGIRHQVILMVEVGDRREGMMPEDVVEAARHVVGLPGIQLVGLGVNVACIGGVLPTRENEQRLVDAVIAVESALSAKLSIVSGGKTDHVDLILRGDMPTRVNQLRIGHGILLGPALPETPLPFDFHPVFNVVAEVIELKVKPSLPEGPIAVDAFGRVPEWEDIGVRQRALLAMGEQDLHIGSLQPRRPGAFIVGASSDHLVVDVTDADPPVKLGDEMAFLPAYAAVATAMARVGMEKAIT